MKAPINLQQESFIKETIELGFKKAAKAFSALSKNEVTVEALTLKYLDTPEQINNLLPVGKAFAILTTDMIGELRGKSYLLFSEEESKKIVRACSPMQMKDGQGDFEDAILLEIDNILSASVITEISNKLNIRVYGDIPSLKKLNDKEVLDLIKKDFSTYQSHQQEIMLVSSTHFNFKNEVHLKPQFIWKFNYSFLESIKNSMAVGGIVA